MISPMIQKLAIALVLVGSGCAIGFVVSPMFEGDALAQSKKAAFKESNIGSVPTEFGDLISVSGTATNSLLAFKNDKGEVRLLEFRGNKLTPRCFKLDRNY